jgi:hypothetical protein
LNAGEMVVIATNSSALQSAFPQLSGVLGDLDFGFSSNGDAIRLYDETGKEQFGMHYQTTFPWLQEPNGFGYTMELVDSTGVFSSFENWFAGCLHGSPGSYFSSCITTQVQETDLFESAVVFPNPTNHELFVQFLNLETDVQWIQVADLSGRRVSLPFQRLNGSLVVADVSQLSSGVYVVYTSRGMIKATFIKD